MTTLVCQPVPRSCACDGADVAAAAVLPEGPQVGAAAGRSRVKSAIEAGLCVGAAHRLRARKLRAAAGGNPGTDWLTPQRMPSLHRRCSWSPS
jgi:hypothetical protein